MEYARQVGHPSPTTGQAKTLETLQKRAMNIIFPGMDYKLSLIIAHVDTMEDRREALTERCFKRSVMPQTSCLRYLLPDRRDSDIVNKCIGDDTKPLVKARPNCINKAKINKIWRETIINMADGIITPCNVSRS